MIELERKLDQIMQIANGLSRADNTRQNSLRDGLHPREQARRGPMHQEREQRAELEGRQQGKNPKLATERPMTDQDGGLGNSDVTARSSASGPSGPQAGLQAAQKAMKKGLNASRRSAERQEVAGDGSSQSGMRAPAASANSRAPPRLTTD
jgi:hypothetical protein